MTGSSPPPAYLTAGTSLMSTAMDIRYCCERAEECLDRAQKASSKEQRLAWDVLAAAWIDYAEAVDTMGKRRNEERFSR
jgi:hypothetical protein